MPPGHARRAFRETFRDCEKRGESVRGLCVLQRNSTTLRQDRRKCCAIATRAAAAPASGSPVESSPWIRIRVEFRPAGNRLDWILSCTIVDIAASTDARASPRTAPARGNGPESSKRSSGSVRGARRAPILALGHFEPRLCGSTRLQGDATPWATIGDRLWRISPGHTSRNSSRTSRRSRSSA